MFPRDYEKNRDYLEVDSKVFVRGRVSEEDDKPSKMICEKIIPFERTKRNCGFSFLIRRHFWMRNRLSMDIWQIQTEMMKL